MTSAPAPRDDDEGKPRPPASPIAVISVYGAQRVVLALLALWTFFAGFSLLTQGVGALSFADNSASAERVVGAHMLVLAPIYGLLAWRQEDYPLLAWIPYAGLLAVILPTIYDLFISRDRDFQDGALMLIVSLIFFVLLAYFRFFSQPAHVVLPEDEDGEEEEDEEYDEELEDDEAEEEYEEREGPPRGGGSTRH